MKIFFLYSSSVYSCYLFLIYSASRPSRTNTLKRCPFHYRALECKSRKSRNTWSNRKIWPWSIEWSRTKAKKFCQENALVIANTLFQQHKRRLYTWTSPDDQHQNQINYILCSQRWRSSIQSAKIRLQADCGSDHELLIAKFRVKLKKVVKELNWRTTSNVDFAFSSIKWRVEQHGCIFYISSILNIWEFNCICTHNSVFLS